MWLSDISIRRPVLAMVMSALLVIFGVVSLTFLSVREYPDIDPPVISVTTVYPGANSEIIESTVTEDLEDELIGIDGIKSMTSVSKEGMSNIIIEFELFKNVDTAAQDVRDRVSRARGRLPDDIEEPVIAKQDTDASAIMWIGLAGKNYSNLQITDYADRYIVDQLQTVRGVGRVILGGAREYSMRVWLDPARMAARGVTVLDVETALQSQNVEIPSGRIESVNREFTVRTRGEMNQAEQFNRLIIDRVNGVPVYLEDIGHAEIGPRSERSLIRMDRQPAVGLGIVKQSKANTLDVAREVKAKLVDVRKTLPPGLTMKVGYDSSIFIQRSIDEVVESLFLAFVLVVLVIYLFLKNIRATFIPAISIPISLIATFIVMYALGYTINTITLLGLTLTIGLVVDDNIVVLENIYRRMEMGESPLQAAFSGVKEIGFAIIATTIVLVAVFVPIAFMQGMVGRILKEFAVVVAFSVIISGFVSLTLTPMLCSRLLRPGAKADQGNRFSRMMEGFQKLIEDVANRFERLLTGLMPRKKLVFSGILLLILVSAGMYMLLPREFLPLDDRGNIITFISSPEGSTLSYTDQAVRQAEEIYGSIPEVERIFAVIALSAEGEGAVNSGVMFTALKPAEERNRKQQDIVQAVMPRMMSIPEALVFPINPPSSPVQGFGRPIQLAIQTTGDLNQLAEVSERIMQRAQSEINLTLGDAQIPLFVGADSDLKLNKPELEIEINRERASALGVSVREIARTLQILLGGLNISTFQYQGKRYDVMVQAAPEDRMTPNQLSSVYVEGRDNILVPLSNVIRYEETVTPKELNHYNRFRAATISGSMNQMPGASMSQVLDQLKRIAEEEMAPGMSLAWKGEAKEFFDANQATYFAFLLAITVVFLVLAAQFESFRDPFIVMLTVPLALSGAIVTLFVLNMLPAAIKMIPFLANMPTVNYTLNVYSQIGLVLLVGLVTKNGILIVEFANQIRERDPRKSVSQAVIEATRIRFRPIVMTSISTVLGALPIAIGLGAGIDARKPLGAVVVGGMIVATFLTLFVIPLVYDLVNRNTRPPKSEPDDATVPHRPLETV